jgi:predicted metalloendopeptidase
MVNWWTKHDQAIYNEKVKDVISQYRTFALRDGLDFDPTSSVGESFADIIGLYICEEYLRDFQMKNDDIIPIKYLSFRAFFTYYAVQMRQTLTEKGMKAQLRINPHPLDKYRVNVPLSRLRLFRSIYDIKKENKMWWHNTDKLW